MPSGPSSDVLLRFTVTLVSTDPPLFFDITADSVPGGWCVEARNASDVLISKWFASVVTSPFLALLADYIGPSSRQ